MANAIYPLYLQALLDPGSGPNSDAPDLNTDTIDLSLHTTAYTYSAAHQDAADYTGVIDSTSETLTSPTVTNGVFDAADTTLSAVASGSTIDSYIIRENTGVAGTSALIVYFDTDSGGAISVATNDGDITVAHNASGIFSL